MLLFHSKLKSLALGTRGGDIPTLVVRPLKKISNFRVFSLSDLDNMHKVILEVPGQDDLTKMADKLKENDISHKLWVEQPENFPTCLALKPYPKEIYQIYKIKSVVYN